jgi:hypothetical protein
MLLFQYLKKGREAGGRIARWAMALSEYNYQIEYLPGKSNLLGDALSRLVAIETEHIADGMVPSEPAVSHARTISYGVELAVRLLQY